MKTLIIVESPTKAKTISKFLPKAYTVRSSKGHIRDLPKSKMGIDIEHGFLPQYEVPEKARATLAELKELTANSGEVILATDEDREGEAIAWHLSQALGLDPAKTKRIVFHEITKKAIEEALKTPRVIYPHLVDAQQARRVLDRLVGYELSPFLWKKIRFGLSAGRVQSVAVRLVCEREEEIRKFLPQEYWTVEGLFKKIGATDESAFPALLHAKNGNKLDKFAIATAKDAEAILAEVKNKPHSILKIEKKETKKHPLPPFTTSTLQQEASKKMGFSSKQTMKLAQQLYEGIKLDKGDPTGLITYMRTDSVNLSREIIDQSRSYIKSELGDKYLPSEALTYTTKSKSAQEAHEAIRPTSVERTPESIKDQLEPRQYKLYNLIWRRTVATQMTDAVLAQTAVDISAGVYSFRANGVILRFDGFLKIYKTMTKESILPELEEGDKLSANKIEPLQHFTEPPARYSEATLIKILEEHGIGRPSTYAPTIDTIQARGYVIKNEDKKFAPTETGELVNKVLVQHFPNIVDIEFTAKMEEDLDMIAEDKKSWQPLINDFYQPFKQNLVQKDKTVSKKELTEEATDKVCPKCGSPMIKKIGKFGKFLACSNYPECKTTAELSSEESGRPPMEKTDKICDKCGAPMAVKMGRYGKFLACSAYPECKNIMSITTGIACPKCGLGEIAEKRTKTGKIFYSCNKYPACDFSLWNKPTGEKCPKCSSLIILAGKGKNKCSSKECDYEATNPS
ncbi:MAG: DNA topoisomerase I [Parcubacteria group bacterium Gr01-1014_18]|nr:MAG: DNA topoisomerase I [Parcubacteria group bacterium Greene0416_36]TSC81280.1 MAG: DNA topoisomerase I [Parcubacteria group bacterium Gr01-1014_18]TSC99302.1 MAG: DNA topoisomerase I [Parcubacteria group bacterium Greene1014_20]TSD06861.1 MAG: DNA topoisomerase I [Parcubacteria group bacterium Greene0714_2]